MEVLKLVIVLLALIACCSCLSMADLDRELATAERLFQERLESGDTVTASQMRQETEKRLEAVRAQREAHVAQAVGTLIPGGQGGLLAGLIGTAATSIFSTMAIRNRSRRKLVEDIQGGGKEGKRS
jgi:hypothetical protein